MTRASSKGIPVILSASVLAAFIITAPTGSQATPARNLQVSPARHEKIVSKAAVEAIEIKAQSTGMQMRTRGFVQESGPTFVQWQAQSKPLPPKPIPSQRF